MLRKNPRDERFGAPTAAYDTSLQAEYSSDEGGSDSPGEGSGRADGMTVTRGQGGITTAREGRGQSVIDAQSSFDGKFDAAQDLVIQGSISGEIVCRGLLTVEREATAKARIDARDAHIHGRVEGDIVCSGRLVLASTATISGTIKAAALVVEEGATVRGSVETSANPTMDSIGGTVSRGARKVAAMEEKASDPAPSQNGGTAAARWTGRREVPSFALVQPDDRGTLERT